MTTTIYNADSEPLYEVSAFTFSEADMGEASVTCDIYLPQDVDPQFSLEWYIDYLGEKFYLSTLQPPAIKDNSLLRYKYSLTFKSEREDLKRYDMLDIVKSNEGDPIPDKYSFSFQGTIEQFVDRFNANLQYNFGTRWEMRLADGVTSESVIVSCQDGVKLWDLLTQVYDLYGLRWYIAAEGDKMVIFVGYAPTEVEHIFEYDPDKTEDDPGNADGTATGGLYSIERVNPLNDIFTRMRGTGGTQNLPYRYFKPQSQVEGEEQYPADPDYNAVIANNSYTNLMPKCFRDYLKGWNGTPLTPETEAYKKGKADKLAGKFIPMDYVVSEKEAKWGVKYGALSANDEIYPTIQGVWDDQLGRIDEIVAVSDLPEEASGEDVSTPAVVTENVVIPRMDWYKDGHAIMASRESAEFEVTADKNEIKTHLSALRYNVNGVQVEDDAIPVYVTAHLRDVTTDVTFNLIDPNTDLTAEGVDGTTIVPAGRYVLFVKAQPESPHTFNTAGWASVTAANITSQTYSESTEADLSQTFNIWIKDIGFDLREPQYWAVDQGDMAVMFSDGLLAGEDYEFTIAAEKSNDTYTKIYFTEDTSKSISTTNEQGDPITVQSKWRVTLIRSDAEYDASGRLLPNSVVNAKAGDHFFFINIQLPQKYVEWAEERLQSYIETELSKVDDEYPTFTVKPSAIFCEEFAKAAKLRAGARIRIRNQRLIGDGYLVVYITSLTLTHSEDKVLPTWDMVVSETPSTSQNAVSLLQGQVEQLSQNVYSSAAALAEAIAQMDRIFLRADGLADTSYSPTTFLKSLTLGDILRSAGFRQAGFAGSGWGIFKDANGNWTLEIDRINLRKDLSVNTVTVNQLSFLYGKYIYARGGIVVTAVEEVEGGHKLYFDTDNGNHPNPFVVNDQAYSLNFNTEAYEVQKYYWALVTEVGADYIVISATDKDGDGAPMAGDNVAQFGHRTDRYRQQALVIDQIEGGSIVQYAHIGDPDAADGPFSLQDRAYAGFEYDPVTGEPRMFSYGDLLAGDRDPLAEDAEYIRFTKDEGEERRTFKIKAQVTIKPGSSGLANLTEWAEQQEKIDAMGYITEALKGSTTISGGLILTSLISLVDQDGATKSGINGIYDPEKLGGGIAAWYGGDMADKFDYYYWDEAEQTLKPKPDVEIPASIAQGVDRMDGTGYRAGGNFWWDADGNIHADPLSFFVGEEAVGNLLLLFRLNYKPDTVDKPFEDVLSVTPMRKFTELQIGEALIEWDDTNKALVFRTADRSGYVGFYGEYTSAKGANPDAGQGGGGGGATALSQLTDVLLSQPTNGDLLSYNGSKWTNVAQSTIVPTLKNLTFGSKTYNGSTAQTITAADLGALTSHQPIYALSLQAGVFSAKTYTPNVGAQTVNIPTKTSHLTNDSGFATKLGVSGNQIGTYVGGKLGNLITVPYATNADMWTGELLSSFVMRKHYTLNLTSLPNTNFYPVVFTANFLELDCDIRSQEGVGTAAYNMNHIHFLLKANGWTDMTKRFVVLSQANYQDGETTIGAVGYGDKQGAVCVWLRGGLQYYFVSNRAPSLKTTDYTYGSEIYAVGTSLSGGANQNVTIVWQNDETRSNSTVALQGGNVASATKLQTARTIWGQSFDGSKNVSGNMTGVGSISATGEIKTTSEHSFRTIYGDYGAFWRNDGSALSLLFTEKGDPNGTFNSLRPFYIEFNSGIVRIGGSSALNVQHAGNVGIGIANPAHKLDVNGDARVTGNFRLNGSYLFLKHYQATGGIYFATDTNGDLSISKHSNYAFSGSIGKIVYSSGNVGIGTSNPAYKLDVTGVIHSTSGIFSDGYMSAKGINTASDMRLKRRIADVALTVRDVAEAPVYRFQWINGGDIDVGSTAQYWAARVPELTHLLHDGIHLGLDYGKAALLSVVSVARATADHERRIADIERQLQNRTI